MSKIAKLPIWLYCALTRKQLTDAIASRVLRSSVTAPLILTKTRQQLQQVRKPRTILVRVAAQAAAQAGAIFESIKGGYHTSKLSLQYISCSKLSGRYQKLTRVDCAGGIVLRTKQDPEILLLLKAEGDQLDWVLPKGRRKAGENRQQTAIREVQEETGLTALKIKKFLGREGYFVVSNKSVSYKRISYYLMYSLEPNSLSVQEREGFIDGRWVNIADALSLTNPTRAHNILNRLTSELGKEKG
ncbi:MAG: NUDIX domain-containing protein [Acidobacteria bacterium]|nr:NUDIX domain-containing protein [Acidobacteriota bacterium]